MELSLFERIGGEAAITATVAKLYQKILDDELLAPFFDDVDVEHLRRSQKAFVIMAMRGPNNYTGKGLDHVHRRLAAKGVSDIHFDAVVNHLRDSMQELNVPEELIAESVAVIENTRGAVLNR